MRFAIAFAIAGMATSSPLVAATVSFTVTGALDSIEYDYLGVTPAFLANTPLESAYQLTFSYDTSAMPLFSYSTGAAYSEVVAGSFVVGNKNFVLQPSHVSVGSGPYVGTRFNLFGNFGPTSEAERLNGFYAVDLSFTLSDPTGQAVAGPVLPTSLDEEAFSGRRLRLRFANGAGETGLIFNVANINSGTATAVPEPASWALMLCGFGGCGAVLRRRHKPTLRVV